MNLKLRRLIRNARKLLPNFNHSDYNYGTSGVIQPGNIALVTSIGPYVPERGVVWLRDDSDGFWEVANSELQLALSAPAQSESAEK
jgi:hypothetical protein